MRVEWEKNASFDKYQKFQTSSFRRKANILSEKLEKKLGILISCQNFRGTFFFGKFISTDRSYESKSETGNNYNIIRSSKNVEERCKLSGATNT